MAFEGISYNIAVSLASQMGVINNNKKATQFLRGTYATKIISWKIYLLVVIITMKEVTPWQKKQKI